MIHNAKHAAAQKPSGNTVAVPQPAAGNHTGGNGSPLAAELMLPGLGITLVAAYIWNIHSKRRFSYSFYSFAQIRNGYLGVCLIAIGCSFIHTYPANQDRPWFLLLKILAPIAGGIVLIAMMAKKNIRGTNKVTGIVGSILQIAASPFMFFPLLVIAIFRKH